MMKILQVSSARAFGGGERHLVDLARGLAARGHEVYAALRRVSPLDGMLSGVSANHIVRMGLRNALDLPSGLKLGRFARDHRIDVIHAHLARDYPPAALAARRAGCALVITRHVLFPLNRLHRSALSNVSRVIAVSEAVGRSLRAQEIFDSDRVRVVANAIDVDRFAADRTLRVNGGRLRVGIVGELSELKGQDTFVKAAAIVVREFGENVEFLIVGSDVAPGAQLFKARIERLIAELALSSHVNLLGQRPEAEIPSILASLDILVSASQSESFGMAMVEAMAAGVPVVATATDGAREIVEDGVTGLITPIGDHEALANGILSLLRNEGRRQAFAEQSVVRARERFTLDRMVTETERVYREAIDMRAHCRDGL